MEKSSTFWTECPFCCSKSQYYYCELGEVLRCQICQKVFEARELKRDVPHPEEPPDTFWTRCPFCCNEFEYYYCELGQLLVCEICGEVFKAHELKKDVHSEGNGGNITSLQLKDATCKPDQLKIGTSAGYSLSDDDGDDDDDFVPPIKSLRKGQVSGAAEKKRNIAAAAVHKKVGIPLDRNLPNKMRKADEFESEVDAEGIEVPDPQFHKFAVVDADKLASLCQPNQTWALYDPADDMPRCYVFIEKVLTPGFKLKVRWLDAKPDDQGEIDWCVEHLPLACGKFILGESDEITDHLMFSHQMHYTKGSRRSSILVYPRRGETWAIYQSWDIGWSSEPEKHVPYKYECVEVLSDFVEGVGIAVFFLRKVKGFVSLFQRTKQQVFQVPPDELHRFSHQIPSFKMTGHEDCGVPSGSFELDPASLPASILICDVGDLKIDNRKKYTKPSDLSGEFVERLVR